MADIDSLDIQISAQATNASKALDALVNRLDKINASLSRTSGSGLAVMAVGVSRLASSMQSMNNVGTRDFSNLSKNIEKLAGIDVANIRRVAVSLGGLAKSLASLGDAPISDNSQKIAELAKGIAQLGYKSSAKAIENIPLLTNAMEDLINKMSKLPTVSQNLIDFTTALANLSRTGASSGRAATSISKSLDSFSVSAKKGTSHSFSLSRAIGKVYASYWLLFRLFGLGKNAIETASALTEVQNIVNTTFGNMSSKVEEFADKSLEMLGMSELTAKKTASTFQSMGAAMGIDTSTIVNANKFLNKQTNGYVELGDSMADVSLNLTKLTADMTSLYGEVQDVSYDDVADDLRAIFTGQTEPLAAYGLILTETTLKEWALSQGLNANIESMTGAEKAMLRYQYVLAHTGAAHGDFSRNATTWSNQIRYLKENFIELVKIVGKTLINAFKPLIQALNDAMSHIIAFADTVSDALGAIFGWRFQSGGIATDYEDAADYADNLADSTGTAADNAKELKSHLLGIDELNVFEPDKGTSGGGSGSGGGVSGGSITETDAGQWVKTESIFDEFESELDTLYELGDYIGTKIKETLEGIDWDSVYEGAESFGSGLADFLNGLISPEMFGEVGKTIAGALNTAIYSALSFGEEFDFEEAGGAIAESINQFFETFDFGALAETLNTWVDGLGDFIGGFLDTLEWEDIIDGIGEFLGDLEIDTLGVIFGAVALKNRDLPGLIVSALKGLLSKGVTISIPSLFISGITLANSPAFMEVANKILEAIGAEIYKLAPDWLVDLISAILGGASLGSLVGSSIPGAGTIAGAIVGAIIGAMSEIKINGATIIDNIFNFDIAKSTWDTAVEFFEQIKEDFENQDWLGIGKDILLGIVNGLLAGLSFIVEPFYDLFNTIFGFETGAEKDRIDIIGGELDIPFYTAASEAWDSLTLFWNNKEELAPIQISTQDFKGPIKTDWFGTLGFWGSKEELGQVTTTYENFEEPVSNNWYDTQLFWKRKDELGQVTTTYEDFGSKINFNWLNALNIWDKKDGLSQVQTTYQNFADKINSLWDVALFIWDKKEGLSKVTTTYEDFTAKLKEKWDAAKKWFEENVTLPKIDFDFNMSTSSLKNALNKVIGWINTYIIDALNRLTPNIPHSWQKILGGSAFSLDFPHIPTFEYGGFPEPASLFWANENGVPELIGTVGGRTAVASGTEITGISDAVYNTAAEELAVMREQNNLLRQLLDKETTVNIGDRDIARANNRGQRLLGRELIT